MKKIHFGIDEEVYDDFRKQMEIDGLSVPQILRAAMKGYGQGKLIFHGSILVTPGSVSRETSLPKEANILKGKPGPKPKITKERQEWFDMDHSKRALKDFDYPDNIHPQADPRPVLPLDEWGETINESYRMMLMGEFNAWRATFSDRMWELEYWNFTRWVAKKFFTLNRITNLRYDEQEMQSELLSLKQIMEIDYQQHVRFQAFYDKHGRLPEGDEDKDE